MTTTHQPGSLVTARGRDWIVMPGGDDPDIIRLRPLGAPDAHATRQSAGSAIDSSGVKQWCVLRAQTVAR